MIGSLNLSQTQWARNVVQVSAAVCVTKNSVILSLSVPSQLGEEDLQKLTCDGGNNACGSSMADGKVNAIAHINL